MVKYFYFHLFSHFIMCNMHISSILVVCFCSFRTADFVRHTAVPPQGLIPFTTVPSRGLIPFTTAPDLGLIPFIKIIAMVCPITDHSYYSLWYPPPPLIRYHDHLHSSLTFFLPYNMADMIRPASISPAYNPFLISCVSSSPYSLASCMKYRDASLKCVFLRYAI